MGMSVNSRRAFLAGIAAALVSVREIQDGGAKNRKSKGKKGAQSANVPGYPIACNPLSHEVCPVGCLCMPNVPVFQCAPTESDWDCCRKYVSDQCRGKGANCKDRWRDHCDVTCSAAVTGCP